MPNSNDPFSNNSYVTSQSTQTVGTASVLELERVSEPISNTTSEASTDQGIVGVDETRYGTGKPHRVVLRGNIAGG